jgi:hypothetical protein
LAAQPTELCGQRVGRTGLEEEGRQAFSRRPFTHLLGGARGQHHHRNLFRPRIRREFLNQFPAVALGHGEVGHDHVGPLFARAHEGILGAFSRDGVEALAAQDEKAHLPRIFVVIDHEDRVTASGCVFHSVELFHNTKTGRLQT